MKAKVSYVKLDSLPNYVGKKARFSGSPPILALELTIMSLHQLVILHSSCRCMKSWTPSLGHPGLCQAFLCAMQMLVDIIAVAKEVQPLGSVKRKSDGADLPRRDLLLADQR